MTNVFNTSFEISLRILIVLNETETRLSIDKISALDFITIYGKDFGVSEYNLHGDNGYRFSEYAAKREIISQAVKNLVLMGYILPHCDKRGFTYSISQNGVSFCQSLNNEYAGKYSAFTKKAYTMFSFYSDREIMHIINDYAVSCLGGKR